jgi:hypothetical protein
MDSPAVSESIRDGAMDAKTTVELFRYGPMSATTSVNGPKSHISMPVKPQQTNNNCQPLIKVHVSAETKQPRTGDWFVSEVRFATYVHGSRRPGGLGRFVV